MRYSLLFVVAVVFAAAGPVASDEKKLDAWPAMIDGKPVKKTFRFKPAKIEYVAEGKRLSSFVVLFRIEDKAVPADLFALSLVGSEQNVKAGVEKMLAADDGHITVDATWVNMPVTVYEQGTSLSGHLPRGRLLVGELRNPPAKRE